MFTTLCIHFSDAQGQLNTVVSGWISLKSKLIQVFMHGLISCQNEDDPNKNKICKSMGIFFRYSWAANSTVQVWIWLKFEHIRDVMVVLVTCKNEEDQLKNDDTRVFTTIFFQTLKGRLPRSQWSDLVEIRTHPSFYALPCFVQE